MTCERNYSETRLTRFEDRLFMPGKANKSSLVIMSRNHRPAGNRRMYTKANKYIDISTSSIPHLVNRYQCFVYPGINSHTL